MPTDKIGREIALGDWITNTLNGALSEVTEICSGDLGVMARRLDILYDDEVTALSEQITQKQLSSNYLLAPANETIDDIVNEYLNYDYNQKFFRVAQVAFSRRILRVTTNSYEAITKQYLEELGKCFRAMVHFKRELCAVHKDIKDGAFVPKFTVGDVERSFEPGVTIDQTDVLNPIISFKLPVLLPIYEDTGDGQRYSVKAPELADRDTRGLIGVEFVYIPEATSGDNPTLQVNDTDRLPLVIGGSSSDKTHMATDKVVKEGFPVSVMSNGSAYVIQSIAKAPHGGSLVDNVWNIPAGGTGGATPEEARVNLEVYSQKEVDDLVSVAVAPVYDVEADSTALLYNVNIERYKGIKSYDEMHGFIFAIVPKETPISGTPQVSVNGLNAIDIGRFGYTTGTSTDLITASQVQKDEPLYLLCQNSKMLALNVSQRPYGRNDFQNNVAVEKGGTAASTAQEAGWNLRVKSYSKAFKSLADDQDINDIVQPGLYSFEDVADLSSIVGLPDGFDVDNRNGHLFLEDMTVTGDHKALKMTIIQDAKTWIQYASNVDDWSGWYYDFAIGKTDQEVRDNIKVYSRAEIDRIVNIARNRAVPIVYADTEKSTDTKIVVNIEEWEEFEGWDGIKGKALVLMPDKTYKKGCVIDINGWDGKPVHRQGGLNTDDCIELHDDQELTEGVPCLMFHDGDCVLGANLNAQPWGDTDFANKIAISVGGTGATTVEEMRNNFSLYSIEEIDEKLDALEQGTFEKITELDVKYADEAIRLDKRVDDEAKALNDRIDTEVKTINTRIDDEVEEINDTATKDKTELNERIDTEVESLDKAITKTNEDINKRIDHVAQPLVPTSTGDGELFIVEVPEWDALTMEDIQGRYFAWVPHVNSASLTPQFKINGLDNKTIVRPGVSNASYDELMTPGQIRAGHPVVGYINGDKFVAMSLIFKAYGASEFTHAVNVEVGGTGGKTFAEAAWNLKFESLSMTSHSIENNEDFNALTLCGHYNTSKVTDYSSLQNVPSAIDLTKPFSIVVEDAQADGTARNLRQIFKQADVFVERSSTNVDEWGEFKMFYNTSEVYNKQEIDELFSQEYPWTLNKGGTGADNERDAAHNIGAVSLRLAKYDLNEFTDQDEIKLEELPYGTYTAHALSDTIYDKITDLPDEMSNDHSWSFTIARTSGIVRNDGDYVRSITILRNFNRWTKTSSYVQGTGIVWSDWIRDDIGGNPSDVEYPLPLEKGGTHAENAEDARKNLDVPSVAEMLAAIGSGGELSIPIPVHQGGTESTTADEALEKLGGFSTRDGKHVPENADIHTDLVDGINWSVPTVEIAQSLSNAAWTDRTHRYHTFSTASGTGRGVGLLAVSLNKDDMAKVAVTHDWTEEGSWSPWQPFGGNYKFYHPTIAESIASGDTNITIPEWENVTSYEEVLGIPFTIRYTQSAVKSDMAIKINDLPKLDVKRLSALGDGLINISQRTVNSNTFLSFKVIRLVNNNYAIVLLNEAPQPRGGSDFANAVSISKGGTNATTVPEARENLSVYSKDEIDAMAATDEDVTAVLV